MHSSTTVATIQPIARPALRSRAPPTAEKLSRITRGRISLLRQRGSRRFWAITHGWQCTTERCTGFGRKRYPLLTRHKANNGLDPRRSCAWVLQTSPPSKPQRQLNKFSLLRTTLAPCSRGNLRGFKKMAEIRSLLELL